MLENRSFDSMLGMLYPKSDQFNGLSGEESNIFVSQGVSREIKVWNDYNPIGKQLGPMTVPTPDPGELFLAINEQLFGSSAPSSDAMPSMSGFAQNYYQFSKPSQPDAIMHYYVPEQVPIISQLARNYAVCDEWFASAPCQTWPNRFFLHTATAGGYENNSPTHFPYLMPTIFTRFNQLGKENGWKIYYHDFPHASTLSDLWPHTDQFHHFYRFKEDAVNGTLPSYSFIEPRYFSDLDFPNDQHPPHDVRFGEALIADVYNTLQASPNWKNTLLIITYDEHGGCYDHVPPPKACPPEPPHENQSFAFDRYGVRVPTIVVSPYIRAG
ncbi:MAG: phosphoesterase, partial [Verrucomicrobia bacterium]|nr:phosphoesterase [Verrucomicrobiota bacterium]